MKSVKLSDFFLGNADEYDNIDDEYHHELYVIRDDLSQILYVGIATSGIWNRWVREMGGHVSMYTDRGHLVFSPPDSMHTVGRYVYDMMPQSLDFIIEMWSVRDCALFLKDELLALKMRINPTYKEASIDGLDYSSMNIKYLEPMMIRKLKPYFNVHFNSRSDKKWEIKQFESCPHFYYCVWDGKYPINMRFAQHPKYDSTEYKKQQQDALNSIFAF